MTISKFIWAAIVAAVLATPSITASDEAAGVIEAQRIESLTQKYLKPSYRVLKDLLSIPSDAHFPEQVAENVAWMNVAFQARNFEITVLETAGPPLLLAERKLAGADKTVLIYLQIDGQPVDHSKWHQENAYVPVLKEQRDGDWQQIDWDNLQQDFDPDWRVFARAASDAKGPVAMFLTALDILDGENLSQTHNVKVVMDFEEELGSPHLAGAVEKYKDQLAADMLLIYDGPRHTSNQPTLYFGARGIVTLSLKVFGPRKPQHSGTYGNYAPNPALRLTQLLASMKDDDGRVTIPGFYDGIVLDAEMRALINDVPDDEPAILKTMGVKAPEKVAATYQESVQYPSLSILGLQSAWVGKQARTIIPASATAELDIRLVPDSDAERLVGLVRQHIESKGYHIIGAEEPTEEERQQHARLASFTHEVAYQAFRTPMNSEAGEWVSAALHRAFGMQPVKIRTGGGSIPISPFVNSLKIPAITVPAVFPQNNQHSPNENLRLGNYVEGIKAYLAILTQPFE